MIAQMPDDFGHVTASGEVREELPQGHSYADHAIGRKVIKLIKLHMKKRHLPKPRMKTRKNVTS